MKYVFVAPTGANVGVKPFVFQGICTLCFRMFTFHSEAFSLSLPAFLIINAINNNLFSVPYIKYRGYDMSVRGHECYLRVLIVCIFHETTVSTANE